MKNRVWLRYGLPFPVMCLVWHGSMLSAQANMPSPDNHTAGSSNRVPRRYTLTDLGRCVPGTINSHGQIICSSAKFAFWLWQDGSKSFPSKDVVIVDGHREIPLLLNLNNGGDIVGIAPNGLPAFWKQGRRYTLPGEHSGNLGAAVSINDRDQIVGYLQVLHGRQIVSKYGFLWNHNLVQNLGTRILPLAINQQGEILGHGPASRRSGGRTGTRISPYLWENGRWTPLSGMTAPADDWELAFNNRRQVVLSQFWAKPSTTLWENGKVITIKDLEGYAIDDRGQIIGSGYFPSKAHSDALLWENGKLYNLNQLIAPHPNWRLKEAIGINNSGQIVGEGEYKGETRGFLLTPVGM